MISYEPLFRTIESRGMQLIDIETACKLSSRTTAKFRKDKPVSLQTIANICKYLKVPIEEVVQIKFDV